MVAVCVDSGFHQADVLGGQLSSDVIEQPLEAVTLLRVRSLAAVSSKSGLGRHDRHCLSVEADRPSPP